VQISGSDATLRPLKFKLGQSRSVQARARIVEATRERGRPDDACAADNLQCTIDRERR
jgi:hypothetical protein